ncbi:MAG: MinD/ParA family protein [Gammaproteobacteria bacterium]|nr:MinD/ParA family protein [Gammaproteobacteria bacterium]
MAVDQASGLRRAVKAKPIRVIAVTSGKGGVGKTNVSVNVAAAWARQGGKPVILDADLGLANIDVALGLQPKLNLSHVLDGEVTMEEIIVEAPGGIRVIPAASGLQRMAKLSQAEHAGVIRAFSELNLDFDLLVVDTAAGIDDSVTSFTRAAQEVMVVVCNEPASITDAYALIKLLNQNHDIHRFRVVANMAHGRKEGIDLFNKLVSVTDRFLNEVVLDLAGIVPYDTYLRKAVQRQRTLVELFPKSQGAQAFIDIAARIKSWPLPTVADGSLQFFVERLVGKNPFA